VLTAPVKLIWGSKSIFAVHGEFSGAMAGKAKARMILIRLVSTARTGYTYTTQKNRKYPTFSIKKYDPMIKRHVLFVEQKMK